MAAVEAASMVGGTIGWESRRKLIHRESFRGFGPPTPLTASLCKKHCSGKVLLDNEFVLIDGTLWDGIRGCGEIRCGIMRPPANLAMSNAKNEAATRQRENYVRRENRAYQAVPDFPSTVTVSTGGFAQFYVQIPTSLELYGVSGSASSTEPWGVGKLVTGTNITFYDLNGNVYRGITNVCGGYQWFTYALYDQESPPEQITNGSVTLTESFSWTPTLASADPLGNYRPTPNSATIDLSKDVLADQWGIYQAPGCPVASKNDSVVQTWNLTVGSGGTPYTVATINITRETNSQGFPYFTNSLAPF